VHLLLDLALRRGHLDADSARRLQTEVEGGRALNEVLVGAGLSPEVVSGLAAELQAAARGVTEALTPNPRPATAPDPAATVIEEPPSGAGYQRPPRERDQETEWLPTGEDLVAPLPPGGGGEFLPGDRIDDFELIELLGEGGMGAVYRAKEVGLGREVALKLVSAKISSDPDAKERFLREARSAGQLNHPNVITILRVSEHEGRPYMVLEFLRGGDAEDLRQAAGGRLAPRRALEIARDCAKGLGALEARGLVHRDIKPANVFLTAAGLAKLADLGLARTQAGDDRVTQTGVIVGTPTFMAPEQADGVAVDIRSDIYALGATLFLLMTGRAPFVGKSPLSVVAKVLSEPTPDPRLHLPQLPAAVAQLVVTAMAKEPDERYQSSADFLAAIEGTLQALVEGRGDEGPAFQPAARTPTSEGPRPSAVATAVAPRPAAKPRDAGRGGVSAVWLIVILALIGLGLASGLALSSRPAPAPAPPVVALPRTMAPPAEEPAPSAGQPPTIPAVSPGPVGSPPAKAPKWIAPPLTTIKPPRGAPGPLNFGVANFGASRAQREETSGPGVVYSFDPGRGQFERSSLFGGSKIKLPARIVWQVRDIEIDRDVPAGRLAEDQGLGDRPTGIFFEFGVRPSNQPCVEGARLEPGSLWVTLQMSKAGEVIGTFRRLNSDKVDRINLGDPGVGQVHRRHRGKMQRRRLTLGLDISQSGWRFHFAGSDRLIGFWERGPAPLTRGEIEGGLYLWTQSGNWERGQGRATVEIQLMKTTDKPVGIPFGRPRKTGRFPRRRGKH
jgi:protein kinase-like protein